MGTKCVTFIFICVVVDRNMYIRIIRASGSEPFCQQVLIVWTTESQYILRSKIIRTCHSTLQSQFFLYLLLCPPHPFFFSRLCAKEMALLLKAHSAPLKKYLFID